MKTRYIIVILLLQTLLLFAIPGCGETPQSQQEHQQEKTVYLDASASVDTNVSEHIEPQKETKADESHSERPQDESSGCQAQKNRCSKAGTSRCTPKGKQDCVSIQNCLLWTDPKPCPGGTQCIQNQCQACQGKPGTLINQTLSVQGELRHYWLHIPQGYRCGTPSALLMDFHGTVGRSANLPIGRPEESYLTKELQDLAEKKNIIMVRPRSLSKVTGGSRIFQWDINPGDLDKNKAFALALLTSLKQKYSIEPNKVYATGFSNGTNMASEFLALSQNPFKGIGMIAGGTWSSAPFPTFSSDAIRLYAVTGYRDYMHRYLDSLEKRLQAKGYPMRSFFSRKVDAGHELTKWHMEEAILWLEQGKTLFSPRPIAQGWTQDKHFQDKEDLLALSVSSKGTLVVAGTKGRLWRKDTSSGKWKRTASLQGQIKIRNYSLSVTPNWTGLCLHPDGNGWAVGEGLLATTKDHGETWSLNPQLPVSLGGIMGYVYLMGIGCHPKMGLVGGGYWNAVYRSSTDKNWKSSNALIQGYKAQITSIHVSAHQTAIAVGNYYIGRATKLEHFQHVTPQFTKGWLYDVHSPAKDIWWAVGAKGQLLHSQNDGQTWQSKGSIPQDVELYAIDFADDKVGAAVGAFGKVFLTKDGGQQWKDISVGPTVFLGDVKFVNSSSFVAVGEKGSIFTYQIK